MVGWLRSLLDKPVAASRGMLDRLDIHGCMIDGQLHLIPNSSLTGPDGFVVFELPPEQCSLEAPDEEVGAAVLRAAARCRQGRHLSGPDLDEVARALGFHSDAALRKKLVPIGISRRNGAAHLKITPMKRYNKTGCIFTDDDFTASIDNLAEIGRHTKNAAQISLVAQQP